MAPESLDWALGRCLAKDPDDRWQTARDLRAELQHVTEPRTSVSGGEARRRPLPWIATATLCAAIAVTVSFLHFREKPADEPAIFASIPIPGNARTSFLALSPDGGRLVVSLFLDGKSQLYVRSLDSPH